MLWWDMMGNLDTLGIVRQTQTSPFCVMPNSLEWGSFTKISILSAFNVWDDWIQCCVLPKGLEYTPHAFCSSGPAQNIKCHLQRTHCIWEAALEMMNYTWDPENVPTPSTCSSSSLTFPARKRCVWHVSCARKALMTRQGSPLPGDRADPWDSISLQALARHDWCRVKGASCKVDNGPYIRERDPNYYGQNSGKGHLHLFIFFHCDIYYFDILLFSWLPSFLLIRIRFY